MAKRTSALLSKYRTLQKVKKRFCAGKANKTQVKKSKNAYVTAAVKKGQTKTEATKKANRILNSGCKMTARIAGKKTKKKKK